MLRGIDPHRHLTNDDVVEVTLTQRALKRAHELRKQELDDHAEHTARRTIELLGEALEG